MFLKVAFDGSLKVNDAVKAPRRSRCRVRIEKKPSTALSEVAELGVKCKVHREWRPGQAFMSGRPAECDQASKFGTYRRSTALGRGSAGACRGHDVFHLGGKGRVSRVLECPDAVRLMPVSSPDTLDRAQGALISPSGPMRGLPWRLSTGQCQNLGNYSCAERRCAGRACLVAQQPNHPLFGKAGLPAQNCWSAGTGPPRHLLHGQPLGRGKTILARWACFSARSRSATIASNRATSSEFTSKHTVWDMHPDSHATAQL